MKFILAAVLILISAAPASTVEVAVSGGVDTADVTVRAVLDLWSEYLDSRPDLMWQINEWNDSKSRFWRDYDLTAPYVYQFDLNDLPPDRSPVVLAIEREGKLYSIRTLFFRGSAGGEPAPWAIVRVYAQFEDGVWKLRSALGVHTADWNRPAIGKITFVTPPGHHFDIDLARRSLAYCDSLSAASGAPGWDPFQFYIARSREEADRIIGLEYHYDGPTDGRILRYHDVVITGTGREWAPHELSGMIVPAQR